MALPACLQGHLGRAVLHGADEGGPPVARADGGAEVGQLDAPWRAGRGPRDEEDVLRLEVGVDDGEVVDVGDGVEDVPRDILQHRQGEGLVPGPVPAEFQEFQ
jgi:hypothetical protein